MIDSDRKSLMRFFRKLCWGLVFLLKIIFLEATRDSTQNLKVNARVSDLPNLRVSDLPDPYLQLHNVYNRLHGPVVNGMGYRGHVEAMECGRWWV